MSKSESRSRSRSASTSSSDSRSRSRKRRYDSRSRSRSRSRSPSHSREFSYTRGYQNQRGFGGNCRGFRRPYYFRGRGQGFFRGHFQRGGRGGYNNYRPKHWQNFFQNPQQQQYPNNPNRGRSHSPKKQSSGQSRRSDRSSSGRSPQSHASTSSNCKCVRHGKDGREDVPVPTDGPDEGGGSLSEQVGGSCVENADGGRTSENSQVLMDHDTSPKRSQVCSSVTVDVELETDEKSSANVTSTCQKNLNASSGQKRTQMLSSFGLFTNDQQTDDTAALSAAFLKFLEEQRWTPSMDNNTDKDKSNGLLNCDKETEGVFEKGSETELCHTVEHDSAGQKEKYRSASSCEGNTSFVCGLQRRSPLLSEDGEEDDEEMEISDKMRDMETNSCKSKAKLSAREMFQERIRRLQDMVWDDELEALLLCHKQERAANILAALSKRELLCGTVKDPSHSRVKRKQKTTVETSCKPSLLSRRSSENHEQEMFVVMSEQSPPRGSAKFSGRTDALTDDLVRSSVMFNERNLLDLVHLDRKTWDLHTVLQHLQAQKLLWSPSEIFSQHIVSIIHYVKAHYFSSSGMTLHERFALYQRRAAEKELMKERKSPEIHRRIDVSPSVYKRNFLLSDEMKNSVENSCKADGKQSKGDSVELRLDIERRKKHLSREREYEGRVLRESPSKDTSIQKTSDNHKKLKIKEKKRERSSSSSSSSSSVEYEELSEMRAEGFSRAGVRLRQDGEPAERRRQFRIHMHTSVKNEECDSQNTSKKNFPHSEGDDEGERKMMEMGGHGRGHMVRGKGRFFLRRPANSNNMSPKWAHHKFQASDDEGEHLEEDVEQHHKPWNTARMKQ